MTTTGRTFLLFSNAGTGVENGDTVLPQLALDTDEDAKFQVTAADGTPTITLMIQGRLRADLPWHDLLASTVTQTDLNASDTYLGTVALYPNMRVVVTANADTTAGNLTVYVLN